jgi:hypothetical protein
MHVPSQPSSVSFVAQPTNWSPHGFEAQTKKPSRWFWGPNHQNRAADFEGQTGRNHRHLFWGQTKKSTTSYEAKPGETIATSFEAKLEKTVAAGFKAKPLETVATGFEAKPVKTVRVVLWPNDSETIDLGFEAQSRNPRS